MQQMSLFKRTPLAPVSENIDPNFISLKESSNASRKIPVDLECHEELEIENDENISENYNPKNFWKGEFQRMSQVRILELYRSIAEGETRLCSTTLYLNNESLITSQMRFTLVEWMAEVSHSCQHTPETLFMAVNYVDRYLCLNQIPPHRLQLIGVAALYLSAKLNDICVPQIEEFSFVTEYSFTTTQIIHAEKNILISLEFNLVVPTLLFFAELFFAYFSNSKYNDDCPILIATLCEYSLIDYYLSNSYPPSILGAAITLFSFFHCNRQINIQEFSLFGLDIQAINNCFSSLTEFLSIDYEKLCPCSTKRFTSVWQTQT